MATVTAARRSSQVNADQCVALRGVGSEGYETLLDLRGDRAMPRTIYLDGDAWLMSPSQTHEFLKKRPGTLVYEIVTGLGIRHIPTSQTTFRRQERKGGVGGDETYYIASAEQVAGKEIDLEVDPPPDLAVEAVHTHDARPALAVYARLGVPEAWVADDDMTKFLRLEGGEYVEMPSSLAFPFLTSAEVDAWLRRPDEGDETEWGLAVRRWVQETLAPRTRRPDVGPR